MSDSKIGPDCPYAEAYALVVGGGERIVDGKSYHPALVRVSMDRYSAWDLVEQLLKQLRHGNVKPGCILIGTVQREQP